MGDVNNGMHGSRNAHIMHIMVTCRAETATPIGVVATDVWSGLVLALLLCADFHRPLPLHGCSTVVLRAHLRLHELSILRSCMHMCCGHKLYTLMLPRTPCGTAIDMHNKWSHTPSARPSSRTFRSALVACPRACPLAS